MKVDERNLMIVIDKSELGYLDGWLGVDEESAADEFDTLEIDGVRVDLKACQVDWSVIEQAEKDGTFEACLKDLAYQVREIAREYGLSEVAKEDLTEDIYIETLKAMGSAYDASKGTSFETFFSRVVEKQLGKWQRKEIRRRKRFADLSEEGLGVVVEETADVGMMRRFPKGDWVGVEMREIQRLVRWVVSRLEDDVGRQICELRLAGEKMETIRKGMGMTKKAFYGRWKKCRAEFQKLYKKVGD